MSTIEEPVAGANGPEPLGQLVAWRLLAMQQQLVAFGSWQAKVYGSFGAVQSSTLEYSCSLSWPWEVAS